MPAYNMAGPRVVANDPSSAPVANPNLGHAVTFSPFSGPKGSPFDYDLQYTPGVWPNVLTAKPATASGNASTGALSTGIGYALDTKVPGVKTATLGVTLPAQQLGVSGYDDDEAPGLVMPDGTAAVDSRLINIGGGKAVATPVKAGDYSNTVSTPVPYVAQPLLAFGNAGSRDAGAGPIFTGFGMKMVTAAGAVATGAAIEAGFVNRSGIAMVTGDSQFGSNTVATAAVT